jgi:thioredoxin 1
MAPVLEQVAAELKDTAVVVDCDVDQAPETPAKYGIFSIPAMIFFKNGQEVSRIVGGAKKEQLVDKLKSLM